MQIKEISINKLKPAKYNPRKDLQPGDPEYEKIKRSIETFGPVDPIVWNEQTGNVVGGHQRLKVYKQLGFKRVKVSVVDLDETAEAVLNVALNKISGEWDYPMLKDLIAEIDTGDFDIELTGFEAPELEEIFSYAQTTIDFGGDEGFDNDQSSFRIQFVLPIGMQNDVENLIKRFPNKNEAFKHLINEFCYKNGRPRVFAK